MVQNPGKGGKMRSTEGKRNLPGRRRQTGQSGQIVADVPENGHFEDHPKVFTAAADDRYAGNQSAQLFPL